MSELQILLSVNIVLQLTLFVLAVKKLRGDYKLTTKHYLFIFGAFVWEDMLVFSLFWAITSVILLLLNSWELTAVAVLIFIIVRALGELIYSLFQQFRTDGHRPFDYGFKKLAGKNIFIIYQVMALAIISLAGFLLYILSTK